MSSSQEGFLRKIRSALGHAPDSRREVPGLFPKQPPAESAALLKRIGRRSNDEHRQLLTQMVEAGKPINLTVTPLADETAATSAIVELVRRCSPEWGNQNQVAAWRHPLIDALDLGAAFKSANLPFYVVDSVPVVEGAAVRSEIRRNVAAAYVGITSADFAMADTATLVMRARPGQPRSVAVVPSVHVAVIELNQILADLKELYTLLRWDSGKWENGLSNYMSFISGPSKTADIEANMVHGAHGPREVHLFVISRRAG